MSFCTYNRMLNSASKCLKMTLNLLNFQNQKEKN
jgi:hypothetical protein